jgi:hypothetical protein
MHVRVPGDTVSLLETEFICREKFEQAPHPVTTKSLEHAQSHRQPPNGRHQEIGIPTHPDLLSRALGRCVRRCGQGHTLGLWYTSGKFIGSGARFRHDSTAFFLHGLTVQFSLLRALSSASREYTRRARCLFTTLRAPIRPRRLFSFRQTPIKVPTIMLQLVQLVEKNPRRLHVRAHPCRSWASRKTRIKIERSAS